jgi:hypothetical protein
MTPLNEILQQRRAERQALLRQIERTLQEDARIEAAWLTARGRQAPSHIVPHAHRYLDLVERIVMEAGRLRGGHSQGGV